MSIKSLNLIMIYLFFCFLFPLSVFTKTYKVSSVDEIKEKNKVCQPGDTLLMRAGDWKDVKIRFFGTGEKKQHIVLCAEDPGKVFLTGQSNLRIYGNYLTVSGLIFKDGYSPEEDVVEFRHDSDELSHNCRLTNCKIIDYNPPDSDKEYKWVSIYGTHNRVDYCYFKGKNNMGSTLVVWLADKPNCNLIDHNYFGFRPYLGGKNNGETIRIGTSETSMFQSLTTVEYNLFEECNGEIETISSKSSGNIFRFNTFVNCKGSLTLRHGNNCLVEGNFFFGNLVQNTRGVRITGEDHKIINNYFCEIRGSEKWAALTLLNGISNSKTNEFIPVKRAIIAFNTFVNNRHTINIGVGSKIDQKVFPEDCLFANNLIIGKRSHLIRITDDPENITWHGNIVYGGDVGIPIIDGLTVLDPLINMSENGLWRPDQNSPIIGRACGEFSYVDYDIDGQSRPKQKKDIGCDQISSSPIERKPLTPNDVGPRWLREKELKSE